MVTSACQLCGSRRLIPVIDLGSHPLADTFLKPEKLSDEEVRYPLRVLLCQQCGYATLHTIVSEQKRYQEVDYSYTSSNSPVSIKHFDEMAEEIVAYARFGKDTLVIDIGGSVGTLVEAFRTRTGCTVVNVEPAPNIAALARKASIPTINDFFGERVVDQILSEHGKAKVICATNVFNHISDLPSFMTQIKRLLSPDGVFVFETPYLDHLVRQYAFDTIYLEHISYFSVKPFRPFFATYGLRMEKLQENEYMGGSIRVYCGRGTEDTEHVERLMRQEESHGVYDAATYERFMKKIEELRTNLMSELRAVKKQGKKIIGIGAATKGNTLLNYCKIDSALLEFITDSSPTKIGKYTPGTHIIIKRDEDITPDITHALILPWNIGDFLKEKLRHLNLEFIIPKINKEQT